MPIIIEDPTAEAFFEALKQVPAAELQRLRTMMEAQAVSIDRSTVWSEEDLQEFSEAGMAVYEDIEAEELQRATAR